MKVTDKYVKSRKDQFATEVFGGQADRFSSTQKLQKKEPVVSSVAKVRQMLGTAKLTTEKRASSRNSSLGSTNKKASRAGSMGSD